MILPGRSQVVPNETINPASDHTIQQVQTRAAVPVITADMQRYDNVEVATLTSGEVSPVAGTSGVSTPSGVSLPLVENHALISRTVTLNPFQPPDLITSSVPVRLPPLRTADLWDLSALGNSSVNYDSNITRNSGDHLADGYVHNTAGFDFRYGTKTEPLAFNLTYAYSADTFSQSRQFDTYTHDFNFTSRVGRSSFILIPFVLGRFRSVEDQSASDSGRESYNFILAGLHGENSYTPQLVHTYDFTHTDVDYLKRNGANFEIWDLSQQLNYTVETRQRYNQFFQLFPWLDLRETSRSSGGVVDEISGGAGMSARLADGFSFRGKVGWGNVSSSDTSLNYDSYSGLRYDAGLVYQPLRSVILSADYQRVLSFNPIVTSRETDELNVAAAFPFAFGPHWTITPSFGLYQATSNDYTIDDESIYLQPSFTVSYKMNEHFLAFGKVEYSSRIEDKVGTTAYTTDLQGSLGFTLLF